MSADLTKCKQLVDDFMSRLIAGQRQKYLSKKKFIKKLNCSLTEKEQDIVYNDYTKRALKTITYTDIMENIWAQSF